MKIIIPFVLLGGLALLICLAGCGRTSGGTSSVEDYYNYECTVDSVSGTFVTYRSRILTNKRMIMLYRFTDGKQRTFMFPSEKVHCAEKVDRG